MPVDFLEREPCYFMGSEPQASRNANGSPTPPADATSTVERITANGSA